MIFILLHSNIVHAVQLRDTTTVRITADLFLYIISHTFPYDHRHLHGIISITEVQQLC